MSGNDYSSAYIEAAVKVEAFRAGEDAGKENMAVASYPARRVVELTFKESFRDDSELDFALATFTEAVKAAARR